LAQRPHAPIIDTCSPLCTPVVRTSTAMSRRWTRPHA
jgi:hypothetical protein